jgi:hypothetical protein
MFESSMTFNIGTKGILNIFTIQLYRHMNEEKPLTMDSNIDENRSVIMKTDKTGPIQFLRFIKKQSVTIQNLRKLKNKNQKIER